jgi:hypothetical protein
VQRKAIIIVAVFLIAGSCGKAREEQKKPVDPLMEVSPALALHVVKMKARVTMCGLLDQVLPGLSDREKKDSDFGKFAMQESATCEVVKRAATNNEAVAASVTATRSIPGSLFFFYEVKTGMDDKVLVQYAIGLFTSLNEMQSGRGTLQILRRCHPIL